MTLKECWKEKPLWLKLGKIFAFIDLLFIVFLIYLPSVSSGGGQSLNGIALGLAITQAPISWLYLSTIGISTLMGSIPLVILGLINWFLIGALIGWIIDKIKSK